MLDGDVLTLFNSLNCLDVNRKTLKESKQLGVHLYGARGNCLLSIKKAHKRLVQFLNKEVNLDDPWRVWIKLFG